MADRTPLPRRALFTDERGVGLRVTWHAERDVVVLSLWRGARCAGTFRMPLDATTRLASFLVAHLGEQATRRGPQPPAARRPSRPPGRQQSTG